MAVLFSSFSCRDLTLRNRVVMSPMCQYKATTDGVATDWHLMHYGARAAGGVGLIIQEATAVEERGRLSAHDLGIYSDAHVPGLRKIVQFCQSLGAKVGIQLAHGGRKAWAGGAPIVGPSAIPFAEDRKTPVELDAAGIDTIVQAWKDAARRAVTIGYDTIEIHAAHGYLINEFLSPYSNKRTDAYGGSFEGRLRLLQRIIGVVREEMPAGMPLLLRVTAHEYTDAGMKPADLVQVVRQVASLGVDLIDVSSGGSLPTAPERYPAYQVPFAQEIKAGSGLPVMAVGRLEDPFVAEAVVRNGWADLACIGRGLLVDPHWAAHAAKQLGAELTWSYQGQEP